MNKIKILYLCSTLKNSGPTNQLFNIITNLNSDKFECIVITLSPESNNSLIHKFKNKKITVISLELSRIKGIFFLRRKLLKQLKVFIPDIIHSQGVRADSLSSSLLGSFVKISTLRNFPQLDYRMTYGKILGALLTKNHISSLNKIDFCVGVSKAVTKNLNENFLFKNTISIQNGVDDTTYYPLSFENKVEMRNKLNIPKNAIVWVTTGHLSERKNPINIINSFTNFLKMNDKHYLVFIGNGNLLNECKRLSNGMNIIFTKKIDNVHEYLKISDYYVSSSKAEGLPNAVLEAMACSLPVLLSNIEPHNEFFNVNLNIGYKFNVDSEFSNEINLMINSDYKLQSKSCLDVINKNFSASIMSKKYQDLYIELLEKDKSNV
ncbi:hypothetical protein OA92_03270 [Marinomonas sp. SBI22]|uniref:glycosyltransferase n=1 Tax=unclassified Marinomonas TaxID=196814 RepID=UPI0007AF5465|nr:MULTISPECIES: glycosyltransferase [unclassified Marinomonas]KZM44899.1 hypothetical protein OA92_03270 [Marinomonas sp. SBI22]KZM46598.1 hypothetical protein OA91_02330 [Marinomonas sp. SBI8L]